MKTVFATLACLLASTAAQAQTNRVLPARNLLVLPPVEYDHPYNKKFSIDTVANLIVLRELCGGPKLACARRYTDHCQILIADDNVIKSRGYTRGVVLRHEIGHCNGWPGHHPGARR